MCVPINSGEYDIEYDDGSVEEGVSWRHIRKGSMKDDRLMSQEFHKGLPVTTF